MLLLLLLLLVFCGGSHRGSGVSDSEASIISKEDPLKPQFIDNSALCVQEPTQTKKLPSLTNEGEVVLLQGCLFFVGG